MFIAIVSSGDAWKRADKLAVNLAVGLVRKGHKVVVYTISGDRVEGSDQKEMVTYYSRGAYRPGSFMCRWSALRDIRRQNYDLIFQLGDSNRRLPAWLMGDKLIVSDIYRSKLPAYLTWTKWVVPRACYLKLVFGDYYVTNSTVLQKNLKDRYRIDTEYIPDGVVVEPAATQDYGLLPGQYNVTYYADGVQSYLDIILEGALEPDNMPFLVAGKFDSRNGNLLKKKYKKYTNVHFIEMEEGGGELRNLLDQANFYFHAYTSNTGYIPLLYAMGSNVLIAAFKDEMNTGILDRHAFYFKTKEQVAAYIKTVNKTDYQSWIDINRSRVREIHNWDKVVEKYEVYFERLVNQSGSV